MKSSVTSTGTRGNRRLFVGVRPSPEVIARVEEALRAMAAPGERGVAWVRPEKLHVTLKFLGGVAGDHVDEVAAALRIAVRDHAPIELGFQGVGGFPSLAAARVLWIGVDDPDARLAALARSVDAECARLGFEREARPYLPHLTIGRVKSPRSPAIRATNGLKSEVFGACVIEEATLYESVASRYIPLETVRLGSAGAQVEPSG